MVAVPLAGAMQSRQDAGNYQVEFEGEMIETTDAELEKLIAEKIMGWRYGYKIDSVGRRALWWMTMGNLCDNSVYMVGVSKWHPLKSADQMFQAVDKVCDEMHLWMSLRSPWGSNSPVQTPEMLNWRVGFTTRGATGWNGRGDYEADAPDMLHAIGEALAKTVEIKAGNGLGWGGPEPKSYGGPV